MVCMHSFAQEKLLHTLSNSLDWRVGQPQSRTKHRFREGKLLHTLRNSLDWRVGLPCPDVAPELEGECWDDAWLAAMAQGWCAAICPAKKPGGFTPPPGLPTQLPDCPAMPLHQ